MFSKVLISLVFVLCLLAPAGVRANERHFTFAYETGTLPRGVFELEPWNTVRIGRLGGDYVGWDGRLELEVGLGDRLQTSLYVNGGWTWDGTAGPTMSTGEFRGLSSEWKFRILTLGVDPMGLAAYAEVTVEPDEFELEA